MRKGQTARGVVVALALVAVTTSGCSSSSSAKSGSQGDGPTASTSSGTAALAKFYAGTDRPLPTTGSKAVPGRSAWVITCGQAFQGCSTPGNAAVAAGRALGWKMTLVDGKLNPATYTAGVNSAIAAHANAIVLVSVDCQFIQAPLQAAKKAGIKIVSVTSFDCTLNGGPAVFDAFANSGTGGYSAYVAQLANVTATYIKAKKNSRAHVLLVVEKDDEAALQQTTGVKSDLKRICRSCTIDEVNIAGADALDGSIVTKVGSALTRHPDVDTVVAPYDASITLGIGQAVKSAGRPLLLTGVEGLAANITQIKAGGPDNFAAGAPFGWLAWAAMDEANRLFAGKPLVDEGIGVQIVDKDHNVPASGAYVGNADANGNPKQDYISAYKKIWAGA